MASQYSRSERELDSFPEVELLPEEAPRPIRRRNSLRPPAQRPQKRGKSGVAILFLILGLLGAGFVMLCGVLLILVAVFAGHPYGTKLELQGGSELYYTSSATKADAEKLADYLNNDYLKNANPTTFQLTKQDGTYQVRICVKEGVDHNEVAALAWQVIGGEMSAKVFGKAPVEIHLCNDHMETLRVIKPLESQRG